MREAEGQLRSIVSADGGGGYGFFMNAVRYGS